MATFCGKNFDGELETDTAAQDDQINFSAIETACKLSEPAIAVSRQLF